MSSDTLKECWLAPLVDFDIAKKINASAGAANDRLTYYFPDDSLDMAVAWTNTDLGEIDGNFGYAGLSMIGSPVVDENGYIINNTEFCHENELGLKNFRIWHLQQDMYYDSTRYDYVSTEIKDQDIGPGDLRAMIATGPFHMKPGDTASVTLLFNFALPSLRDEPSGEWEDMSELVEKAKEIKAKFCEHGITQVKEKVAAQSSNFDLYPNPATSQITLSLSKEFISEPEIDIIDYLGNVIRCTTSSRCRTSDKTITINTSSLSPGVYFLRIRSGEKVEVRKFVVFR